MEGKKRRMFQLTLNNVEKWEKLLDYLRSLESLGYLIASKEKAPTTGHEHIHCFVQFKKPICLSLKKTQQAHIEVCKGSPQQNKRYVEKGEIIEEIGEIRLSGCMSIKEVSNMSDDDLLNLPFVYYEKVKSLKIDKSNLIKIDEYKKEIKVYYLYGESGSGKTQTAIKMMREEVKKNNDLTPYFNEIKCCNGFWIGVDVQNRSDIAFYDDFRDSHMVPSEFINFIDYNVHNMNIKNGHVKNHFKLIFITSIQSPFELYSKFTENNEEPKKQWLRRITEIINLKINN